MTELVAALLEISRRSKLLIDPSKVPLAEAALANAVVIFKTSAVPSPASIEPPVPSAETLRVTVSLPAPKVLALVVAPIRTDSAPSPPVNVTPAANSVANVAPAELVTFTAVTAVNVSPDEVKDLLPAMFNVVASAKEIEPAVEAVVEESMFTVVKPSSADASESVNAPDRVRPLRFTANVLAVGVAVSAPREIPRDVPLPERLTAVNALESIVAAAKLPKVTVSILPAAVAEAALVSVIVTAPLTRPTTVAEAVAAAVSLTVTDVVEELPATVTAPAVVDVLTALLGTCVMLTVVPPVTVIALPVVALVEMPVEETVTAPAAAVVPPIATVPPEAPVSVKATVGPPLMMVAPVAVVPVTATAVVAAAVTV